MRLDDISNTAYGYNFFFEGEDKVNGFSLRFEYGRDEDSKDSFLCVSPVMDDNRYICFADDEINNYWNCITSFFQEINFQRDEYDDNLIKLYHNGDEKQAKVIEDLYNEVWKDELENRLKNLYWGKEQTIEDMFRDVANDPELIVFKADDTFTKKALELYDKVANKYYLGPDKFDKLCNEEHCFEEEFEME